MSAKLTSEEKLNLEASPSKISFRLLTEAAYRSPKFKNRFDNYERDVKSVQVEEIKQFIFVSKKIKPFVVDKPKPNLKSSFRIRVFTKNNYLVELYMDHLHVDSNVKIRCACPDFKFRFWYVLWRIGASFGRIQKKTQAPPNKTNPDQQIGVCKHCIGVMQDLVDAQVIQVRGVPSKDADSAALEALGRLIKEVNNQIK